jgi:hypothetical protein
MVYLERLLKTKDAELEDAEHSEHNEPVSLDGVGVYGWRTRQMNRIVVLLKWK